MTEYFTLLHDKISGNTIFILIWLLICSVTCLVCGRKRKSLISFEEIMYIMLGCLTLLATSSLFLKAIFWKELQELIGTDIIILEIGLFSSIYIAMSGIAKIFNKTQENLGTSQKPELEEQDRELLVDLIQHGGATLKQIIIKTNRIGQEKNVRSSLKNLEELGYIKRVTYNGDGENEIFTPSRIALQNFYSILKRK